MFQTTKQTLCELEINGVWTFGAAEIILRYCKIPQAQMQESNSNPRCYTPQRLGHCPRLFKEKVRGEQPFFWFVVEPYPSEKYELVRWDDETIQKKMDK